jgi:hypothetical protein
VIVRVWKQGERVIVKHEGRTVEGRVLVASENGVALVVDFEAILGEHAGLMPILWKKDADGAEGFVSVFCGHRVELEEAPAVDPSAVAP